MQDRRAYQDFLNSLDRRYDPQAIADDMARDMDENHEWYESMRAVDKPRNLVARDEARRSRRRGWHVDTMPKPFDNEVIVSITKPKATTPIFVVSNQSNESPLVTVMAVGSACPSYIQEGHSVVIDAAKYMYGHNYLNTYRFMFNDLLLMRVKCDDIIAVVESGD